MCESICRRATLGVLAVLTAVGLPIVASAATINIILSDMDVTYLGTQAAGTGAIYDSMDYDTDNLDPAPPDDSDEIETAVFELDGVNQGTWMSSVANRLFGDLRIDGIGTTIALGPLHTGLGTNGNAFGFDLFTSAGPLGDRLRLGISSVDLLLTQGVFFFTGTATVLDQDLPFGLRFDPNEPVVFSYTATLPGVNGSPARGAMGSGAFTISGTAIPEPATFGLLCLAAIVARVATRRRRG
jgi:hypothetical protein